MRVSKRSLLCLMTLPAIFTLVANPAKRVLRTFIQPDGTKVEYRIAGDENFHFATLDDGRLLYKDEDGAFSFGFINEAGTIASTGIKYSDNPSFAGTVVDDNCTELMKRAANGRKNVAQSGKGISAKAFPRVGSPKGLIILVQFSDVAFTVDNPAEYFNNMINGDNFTDYGATGSVRQYFSEQSDGRFTPSFDIYGPVTLPETRTFYGHNDANGHDANAVRMVIDAIDLLDAEVDFSQYDLNGDKFVDNIYIFYAGQGESSYGDEDTVWPHSRATGINKTVDGVRVDGYACSNEWEKDRPDGIGTFVHEFSHVMGLPDLYSIAHTDAAYTPGPYSVLDSGSYNNEGRTPPNYGAYERNALGWSEPIMLDEAMSVTLDAISTGEYGMIPTADNNEFYLLENRVQEGWDAYLPGHGMLIWHIDYDASSFSANAVNDNPDHQKVDIIEANGIADNKSSKTMEGWTFPGTSRNTEFTPTSTPAMTTWSGEPINLPVTDITENDGLISFNIAGGESALSSPHPDAEIAGDGSRSFTASWEAVSGATDYLMNVYAVTDYPSGDVFVGFENMLFCDWDASDFHYYSTSNNFGRSVPSFKFDVNGQTLTSPELEGNVTCIKFWIKGNNNDQDTYLTVEGHADGRWISLARCVPSETPLTVILDSEIPVGVRRVRFTMTKNKGEIALDDVTVAFKGQNKLLTDYDGLSTSGETSVIVDKLIDTVDNYFFTVSATDGETQSKASTPTYIDLSTSGVANVAVDENGEEEYYSLQGIRISAPIAGGVYIRKQGIVSEKVSVK